MNPAGKKKILQCRVLSNRKITEEHYMMGIEAPWLAKAANPGQFVNIKAGDNTTDPLLRIPMGIYKVRPGGISFLYKVIGKGTRLLAERKKGETLDVLGPLGKGFDLALLKRKKFLDIIMVSGGHGVVPLNCLAEHLSDRGSKIDFFMGARTAGHIAGFSDVRKTGARVHIATDDGTRGYKGCVTDLLVKHLDRGYAGKNSVIYACGPRPMIAVIKNISMRYGVSAQVTYDEYMACGIGACRGCAVDTVEGIKLACKDGPVFDAEILRLKSD